MTGDLTLHHDNALKTDSGQQEGTFDGVEVDALSSVDGSLGREACMFRDRHHMEPVQGSHCECEG